MAELGSLTQGPPKAALQMSARATVISRCNRAGSVCVQAHSEIVGGIQVTADCWPEALGVLLAVG